MWLLDTMLLSLALSADAFSVAAAVGLVANQPRQVWRLSLHFGVFQALMTGLGALLGILLHDTVRAFDHWVAFGLLEVIGLRMLWGAMRPKQAQEQACATDPTKGLSLVGLSLAVSIDAFGAGVGMAMAMNPFWVLLTSLIIGLVCAGITWLGMRLGCSLRRAIGSWVEALGGGTLVLLGVRMLWI